MRAIQDACEEPLILGLPNGVAEANGTWIDDVDVIGRNQLAIAAEEETRGVLHYVPLGQIAEQGQVIAHEWTRVVRPQNCMQLFKNRSSSLINRWCELVFIYLKLKDKIRLP